MGAAGDRGCPDRELRDRSLGCLAGRSARPRLPTRPGSIGPGSKPKRPAGWPSAGERTRLTGSSPISGHEPAVQNSAQATAGISALEAEIRLTQGRWIEAFEASRRGWNQTDNARIATQLSQFAAAAAGDASRLREAVKAQISVLADELPLSLSGRQIALTLTSLLDGRWDEARLTYLKARRIVEEVGNLQLLALLQLTVGQLGADHFSEAAQALQEAEEYFHARGADAFVATYREHAREGPERFRAIPHQGVGRRGRGSRTDPSLTSCATVKDAASVREFSSGHGHVTNGPCPILACRMN